MQIFTRTTFDNEEEGVELGRMKTPSNIITLSEFHEICMEKLERILNNETLELVFYVFDKPTNLDNVEIDFNLFARLFYLIYKKNELVNLDENDDEFIIQSEGNNRSDNKENLGEYDISKVSHDDKKILDYDENYDEGEDYNDDGEEYD